MKLKVIDLTGMWHSYRNLEGLLVAELDFQLIIVKHKFLSALTHAWRFQEKTTWVQQTIYKERIYIKKSSLK